MEFGALCCGMTMAEAEPRWHGVWISYHNTHLHQLHKCLEQVKVQKKSNCQWPFASSDRRLLGTKIPGLLVKYIAFPIEISATPFRPPNGHNSYYSRFTILRTPGSHVLYSFLIFFIYIIFKSEPSWIIRKASGACKRFRIGRPGSTSQRPQLLFLTLYDIAEAYISRFMLIWNLFRIQYFSIWVDMRFPSEAYPCKPFRIGRFSSQPLQRPHPLPLLLYNIAFTQILTCMPNWHLFCTQLFSLNSI